MERTNLLFASYLFLAVYCAGSMSVLQLQHFALYPKVGREAFKEYVAANNKAAVLPAIIPAVLLTLTTVLLLFLRPAFMGRGIVLLSLMLNLINLASSFIWQARLHGQLARMGYDAGLIDELIQTNWIRTIALLAQGLLAVYCTLGALEKD